MAKISAIDIPSLNFEELASDPATPDTGFWRLYTKSDGLYVIDDAGSATGPLGTGGGGGGSVGASDIESYTGGDITVSSTTAGAAMSGPGNLTVAASAGDLLTVGLSARDSGAAPVPSLRFDVATIVSASATNYMSSGSSSPASTGVSGWFMHGSTNSSVGPSLPYVVQAGDIDGGNVVLSLRAWMSGGSRVVAAQAAAPLVFWVKNLLQ